MIKHVGDKWILYTKDGSKKLGTHDSEAEALAQERAIEASKHRAAQNFADLLDTPELRALKADRDEHPFTYCMQTVVPAMKNTPDDPEAFCGWWKAEYAAEHEESRHLHILASGTPRKEMLNGREHLVIPVTALMEGVIHAINAETPEFVPSAVIQRAAHTWNGRPLVVYHPVKDGRQISANHPTVLQRQAFGQIFESKANGTRLGMEAWVDPVRLRELGEHELLTRIEAGKPIEVSVGAYVKTRMFEGNHNGRSYKAEWTDATGDHLAFLPKGRGACSLEMGCGAHRAAEESPMLYTLEGAEPEVLGGKGSGNFGHEGRPGQVGGSGGGKLGEVKVDVQGIGGRYIARKELTTGDFIITKHGSDEEIARVPQGRVRDQFGQRIDVPQDVYKKVDELATTDTRSPDDPKRIVENINSRLREEWGIDEGSIPRDRLRDDLARAKREKDTRVTVKIPSRSEFDMSVKEAEALLKLDPGRNPYERFRGFEFSKEEIEELRTAIGARNNSSDMKTIQSMHDSAVALGAKCDRANYKLMEQKPNLKAACGCKGEKTMGMTKDKKAELIATLVTDKFSGFKEGDEALLEAASDEQLETFRSAAETRKTETEERTKLQNDLRTASARIKVVEDKLKTAEEKPTADQWMEKAPAEIRALIDREKQREIEERETLVAHLKTAQDVYTEDELKALETPMLQRLAKIAKVEAPANYSGRKVPVSAEKKESYAPPDPYAAGIKALQEQLKIRQ